ncbi:hypothetical protein [Streptomyces sp. Wb2n-11]|uniref:hypothetical protein n=1 Tax=Streptomyces sp. Wb2n-11 TaxID=1030533 RepID=UPI00159EE063|nr:hypothetical protein [Streptomyces sp. Wb2n-11]
MKKTAIEEHFTTAALAHYSEPAAALSDPPQWDTAMRRLLDFTDVRLPQMDELGIDMEVLSLTAPGIQAETDTAVAVKRAARANDADALVELLLQPFKDDAGLPVRAFSFLGASNQPLPGGRGVRVTHASAWLFPHEGTAGKGRLSVGGAETTARQWTQESYSSSTSANPSAIQASSVRARAMRPS